MYKDKVQKFIILGFSDLQGRVDMLHISGLEDTLKKSACHGDLFHQFLEVLPDFHEFCWPIILGKRAEFLLVF